MERRRFLRVVWSLLAVVWGCGDGHAKPSAPNPPSGLAGSAGSPMQPAAGSVAPGAGGAPSGAAGTSAWGSGAAGLGSAGEVVGGAGGGAEAGSGGSGGAAGSAPPTTADPFPGADVLVWQTEQFSLQAGQERYLCYAKTLEEDAVVNAYNSRGDRFVHHVIFSRARSPQTEGFEECDVSFRSSWEPLFLTGAGDTTLEFPADAGHRLTKGTQLIVQMHLLNVATAPVDGALTITMRKSATANPRPVSGYVFGTAAVELPPGETTEVVGTCAPRQDVKLIAGFPHMHMLGSSMTFEVGASASSLREVFKRDPFDFDDQRIEKLDLTVKAGEITRVRCTFDNTLDEIVRYGESSRNEMCFFVGFAVDQPRQSACLEVVPPFDN